MRAIVAREAGGPEVLELVERPDPSPGEGELVVRAAAIGVNFIDTYRRAGVYQVPYPHVPGSEGSGTVEAVGAGVVGFAVGDRVLWHEAKGSYAELVTVRAADALPVPAGVELDVAGAVPLQGFTAHYLCNSTYPVQAGDWALVHAGAGGVGLLLTQLIVARGGRVISTVGTPEKADLARAAGAEHTIHYREFADLTVELPAAVKAIVGPAGVPVVFDSVGKDTFDGSLACLRPRGMMVLFGGSSGQVPPVDPQRLNAGGSLFLTRPTLAHYTATRDELEWRGREVLGAVASGSLQVRIGARFALADAAAAHRALEGRGTTGKVILVP